MKNCNDIVDCPGRREFLVKAGVVAGGLVLTLSGIGFPLDRTILAEDVVIPIDNNSPLNKIGGWAIIDSTVGKIIILRTGEASFAAFSARCTHKGGIVAYDDDAKRFVCPRHGSVFNSSNGDVVKGPAEDPLTSYPAHGTANSVTVSTGS